jgi:NAD dependent epimerase/dehydratase family enzyme
VVAAIEHVIASRHDGPLNVVASHPVRQREVARALGRVLGRPAVLPAPAFALRTVLGGFASELLSSRRVSNDRLLASGFAERFGELEPALESLCR